MITVNKANPTPGEITSSLTGSTGDGAGLHLDAGGTITLANAAAAEFGTSDFSLEFVLNRTANNTNNNVIYESHSSGNNRITLKALTGGDLIATFTNSSGVNADYNTGYDIDVDLNTVTHYALTFDRSGDLTVYKNGNSVATISIAASSSVDIGASNTNTGRIGYVTTYGVIGTFYRFRAFNTLADAKLLFERADVPQTLTANLLFDLDLAFANPTQSLTVQDRSGAADGTCSASGVSQVNSVVQVNATSARIGTSAATPADGQLIADSLKVGSGDVSPDGSPTLLVTDTSAGGSVIVRGQSPILAFDKTGSGTATILTDGGGLNVKDGTMDSHGNTHLAISSTGAVSIPSASGTQIALTVKGGNDLVDNIALNLTNQSGTGVANIRNNGRIHTSTGIVFDGQTDTSATGATATGTTLSHFEEGSWTPAFSVGAISGSNITYTGRYTRIGKLVYIYCKISATANDLVIGNYVGLSGLPFTAAASASGFSTTEDIDLDLGGEVNIGSTTIFFGATGSATSTQTITATLTYEV